MFFRTAGVPPADGVWASRRLAVRKSMSATEWRAPSKDQRPHRLQRPAPIGQYSQSKPNRTALNAASSTARTARWNDRSAAVARWVVRAGCNTNSSSERPGTSQ